MILLVSAAAYSATSDSDPDLLMAAGNAEFRSGNYSAALQAYEAARAKGYDSPLLHFNIGVAHYKLGEYEKAGDALKSAALNPDLAPLAYLNLALASRKSGHLDQAKTWLNRARDSAENEAVRRHVTRVLAVVDEEQALSGRSLDRTIRTSAARRRPEFAWFLSSMVAFDSNAFRSPGSPYIDLGETGTPLVNPRTQSGFYIPISARAEYTYPVGQTSSIGGSYQYRGNHYLDSDLGNADENVHRITLGFEKLLGERLTARRRVGAAVVYRMHEETDFDRDDGLERLSNGANVSDRFDYDSIGLEATLRNRHGRFGYGFDARFEQRDYEDLPAIFSYDHDFMLLGGHGNFRITPRSRVELGYTYYVRDYDERRARDSLGDALFSSPTLEYAYHKVEAIYLQRFSEAFLAELNYAYTIRDDAFVGYNDYDQHRLRLAGSYRFSPKLRSVVRISWRDQDYPNAFAFNEPTASQKQYDELEINFITEYALTERLSVWARIRFEDVGSSDPRGEYDRARASIGISWEGS